MHVRLSYDLTNSNGRRAGMRLGCHSWRGQPLPPSTHTYHARSALLAAPIPPPDFFVSMTFSIGLCMRGMYGLISLVSQTAMQTIMDIGDGGGASVALTNWRRRLHPMSGSCYLMQ